jgi:hypothetical protein
MSKPLYILLLTLLSIYGISQRDFSVVANNVNENKTLLLNDRLNIINLKKMPLASSGESLLGGSLKNYCTNFQQKKIDLKIKSLNNECSFWLDVTADLSEFVFLNFITFIVFNSITSHLH